MTSICITNYSAVSNIGNSIEEIFANIIKGDNSKFDILEDIIPDKRVRFGGIKVELPKISDPDYNIRCNQIILYCINQIKADINTLIKRCGKDRVGVVVATTNTGVDEFGSSNNKSHAELGNPALFLKEYLGLDSCYLGISTACSSGSKAFMSARNLLNNDICDAVIVCGVDALSILSVFGFDSLEILTNEKTNPLSKNRSGINLGEAGALFILEKESSNGIRILGIGESSDAYHYSTPDPSGTEAANAVKTALKEADLEPEDIDYINLHGTGTISNDLMEANAIYSIFKDNVYASSTKPLTGHCLGAAASIEIAICCAALSQLNPENKLPPHIYDGEYDDNLRKVKLVKYNDTKTDLKTCLSNSFGFGGTNSVIILGKQNG